MGKDSDASTPPDEPVSLREFWARAVREEGLTMTQLAVESGVARSVLHRHLVEGHGISVKNANKVADWSRGRVSAAKTAGARS